MAATTSLGILTITGRRTRCSLQMLGHTVVEPRGRPISTRRHVSQDDGHRLHPQHVELNGATLHATTLGGCTEAASICSTLRRTADATFFGPVLLRELVLVSAGARTREAAPAA